MTDSLVLPIPGPSISLLVLIVIGGGIVLLLGARRVVKVVMVLALLGIALQVVDGQPPPMDDLNRTVSAIRDCLHSQLGQNTTGGVP